MWFGEFKITRDWINRSGRVPLSELKNKIISYVICTPNNLFLQLNFNLDWFHCTWRLFCLSHTLLNILCMKTCRHIRDSDRLILIYSACYLLKAHILYSKWSKLTRNSTLSNSKLCWILGVPFEWDFLGFLNVFIANEKELLNILSLIKQLQLLIA